MAPGPQKLASLSTVFWPQASHGSSTCLIADNYANALRKEAVKALKLNGSGSNPLLRLSLSDTMQADPGFYQIQLCLATFRRLLRKNVDLLHMWHAWHQQLDGRFLPGPFSRLAHCLFTLGWHVTQPPFIMDHEGHTWNRQRMDDKTLDTLLQDSWLQYVAAQTRHTGFGRLSYQAGLFSDVFFGPCQSFSTSCRCLYESL